MNRLKSDFYTKDAETLAPLLLGKLLVRKLESGKILKYRITETECYCGEQDTACHARVGKTDRTSILYEKGGRAYIYLCYGIHSLLNVVANKKDVPEAVLIRAVEGFIGPGKLTKALSIDRRLNKIDLTSSDKLWIEDDGYVAKYATDKRVGIEYATEYYKNIEWRFILEN